MILKFKKMALICICFLFGLSGCTPMYEGYIGEHPALYTTAISSLLGVHGFTPHSEGIFISAVQLIEKDEYNRSLFCYAEDELSVSLLICQDYDEEYAYFYSDFNFISKPLADGNILHLYGSKKPSKLDDPLNGVSENEIEALKENNDWNKEKNISKCSKAKIVYSKPGRVLSQVSPKIYMEVYKTVLGNDAYEVSRPSYMISFIEDDYGRSIDVAEGKNNRRVVFMLNPDGSYNAATFKFEWTDLYNYQNELKALKELNHWNEPWSGGRGC